MYNLTEKKKPRESRRQSEDENVFQFLILYVFVHFVVVRIIFCVLFY